MRLKLLATLVLLAVAAVLGAGWLAGRAESRRLGAQRAALQGQRTELARLQSERQQLRATLTEAMRRASARDAEAARQVSPGPVEPPAGPAPSGLKQGEWLASHAWGNRGQGTATAAVETALWTAAGGDVPAFVALLELDDAARARTFDLLDRLPAETRHAYGSPEELIASVTVKNIPLTEAQVAWYHEADADHAIVGLLLGNPGPAPAVAAEKEPAGAVAPPALPDDRGSKLAYLSLHRTGTIWRLVVPAAAVERIGRELSAPVGGGR